MKNLTYILAIILLCSCGSRKKALEKSIEKTKTETVKEVDSVVQNDIQKTETKEVKEITTNKETTTDFEGTVKDSINEASVNIKQETDGSVTRTYKGFKTVKEKASSKDQISDIAITDSISTIDKSKIDLTKKEQTDQSADVSKKVVNVDRDNTLASIGIVAVIFGIIVIGIMIYFWKYRK